MERCRTPQMLHNIMVSHRAQLLDLYYSCSTPMTSTKTLNRVSAYFADDSIIYRKINSNIDHQILQTDFIQLEKWSDKWQMLHVTSGVPQGSVLGPIRCTSTASTKTPNRVSASLQMIALYIAK